MLILDLLILRFDAVRRSLYHFLALLLLVLLGRVGQAVLID